MNVASESASETPGARPGAQSVPPLSFAIDIEDGVGSLILESRPLSRLGRIDRMAMDVPDLKFPFDLSGGVAGFRHRRCRLRSAELSVGTVELRRFAHGAGLSAFGFKRVEIRVEGPHLVIQARVEIGGAGAELGATAILRPVPPRRIRVAVFDVRVYGFMPVAAPILISTLLAKLVERSGKTPAGVALPGPTEIEVDALDLALFDLLPARGWRLPARTQVRVGTPRFERQRIVLKFAAGPGAAAAVDGGDEEDSFEPSDPTTRTGAIIAYEEGRALFGDGEDALRVGDGARAHTAFRRALALHPDNGFAATRLLQILTASKNTLGEADELAGSLLAKRPRFVPALLARAIVAAEAGRLVPAAEIYERLAGIGDPAPATDALCAETAAAELRLRAGEAGPALAALERVRAADPSHPRALDLLRKAYAADGRTADWLTVLRQRELDEPDASERARLSCEAGTILLDELGQSGTAGERFAQAVLLDDNCAAGWEGMGKTQALSQQPEKALSSFERAAALFRADGDRAGEGRALSAQGEIEESLGHDDRALAHFAAATAVTGSEPGPAEARRRARVLHRLGRSAQAIEVLRNALKGARDASVEADLRVDLASILATATATGASNGAGGATRARIEVEEALRLDPNHLGALRQLAALAARAPLAPLAGPGGTADVLVAFRRAIERCEDADRMHDLVAEIRKLIEGPGSGVDADFLARTLQAAARSATRAGAEAASAWVAIAGEPGVAGGPSVEDLIAVVESHLQGKHAATLAAATRARLSHALAGLRERRGDTAGAVAALEACLESGPPPDVAVAAWRRIVELKARSGDAAGAARALIASADDGRTAQTASSRAALLVAAAEILRERLQMPEDAMPLLDRATLLDPQNDDAFDALEAAAVAAGDFERVAEVLARRCEYARPADRPQLYARLAAVLGEQLGRVAEAAQARVRAREGNAPTAVPSDRSAVVGAPPAAPELPASDPRDPAPALAPEVAEVAPAAPTEPVGPVAEARRRRTEGDLDGAEAALDDLLAQDIPPPTRVAALLERAAVSAVRRDADAATADLEEALAIAPRHPGVLGLLADIRYQAQDWQQARRIYQALADVPEFETVIEPALLEFRLAELAETFGDEAEAEACYRKVVTLDPDHAAAHEALAEFAALRHEYAEVARCLEIALNLNALEAPNKLLDAREHLGDAYLKLERFDDARAQLDMVLADEPERVSALERLAAALEGLGVHTDAAGVWGHLSRLYADARARAEALFRQGELLRLGPGDQAASDDAYLRAADMDPTFAPALIHLVEYYWRKGDRAGVAEVGTDLWKTEEGRAALSSNAAGFLVALAAIGRPHDRELARAVVPAQLPDKTTLARLTVQLGGMSASPIPVFDGTSAWLDGVLGSGEGTRRLRVGAGALLAERPDDAGALALFGRLAERAGASEVARAAYAVHAACDPASSLARAVQDVPVARALAPSALAVNATLHADCPAAARRVLAALAPVLAGFAPDDGVRSKAPLDPDATTARVLADLVHRLATPPVLFRLGPTGTLELLAGLPVAVALGPDVLALPRAELQFYLAVALDQIRSASFVIERFGAEHLVDVFVAIVAGLQGLDEIVPDPAPGGDLAFRRSLAAHIRACMRDFSNDPESARLLPTPSVLATVLADARSVLAAPPDFDAYVRGCRFTANRVGLLVCGDPTLAMHAAENALRAGDPRSTDPLMPAVATTRAELARPGSPLRELVLYMLSEDYGSSFFARP